MCRLAVTSLSFIFIVLSLLHVFLPHHGCALEIEPPPQNPPSDVTYHNVRASSETSKQANVNNEHHEAASLQMQASSSSKDGDPSSAAVPSKPKSSADSLSSVDASGVATPIKPKSSAVSLSSVESPGKSNVTHCEGESCTPKEQPIKQQEGEPAEKPTHAVSHSNENEEKSFPKKPSRDAFIRGLYVLSGLSLIAIIYFGWQSYRLRRKKTHVHKYGVVANREDLEMAPLEMDDEDDDTTHFDLSNHLQK